MATYEGTSNWGRWGMQDQLGTLNLLDSERALAAIRLVRHGRVVALGRTIDPAEVQDEEARLDQVERRGYAEHPGAGAILETYTFRFHGAAWTHLDGLAHVWDAPGMWNGRDPDDEVETSGVLWADITHPARGMVGRGLLFDVVRWRSGELVTPETPITAREMSAIASFHSLQFEPGDMLVIRGGRPEWEARYGPYGSADTRPGLDSTVLDIMAESDCSVLISDMLDAKPHGLDRQWSVHAALYQLGAYLVDNADLTTLASSCHELAVREFMVVIAPLAIRGATASPVSPLAIL